MVTGSCHAPVYDAKGLHSDHLEAFDVNDLLTREMLDFIGARIQAGDVRGLGGANSADPLILMTCELVHELHRGRVYDDRTPITMDGAGQTVRYRIVAGAKRQNAVYAVREDRIRQAAAAWDDLLAYREAWRP